MNDTELKEFGIKLAKQLKWSGVDILIIAQAALEESNFHPEAAVVESLVKMNERMTEVVI